MSELKKELVRRVARKSVENVERSRREYEMRMWSGWNGKWEGSKRTATWQGCAQW